MRREVLFIRCWLLFTGSRTASVQGGLVVIFDDQQAETQHLQDEGSQTRTLTGLDLRRIFRIHRMLHQDA